MSAKRQSIASSGVRVVVALAVLLSVTAPLATAAQGAQTDERTQPAFVVDLQADSDARITLRLTYNLSEESERKGFRQLQENQSRLASSFADRLSRIAERIENRTGRSMSITDPAVEFRTADSGNTGVVELSATWTNLAAGDGDRLVVREPFESGFQPERHFVVRAPDGYTITAATPEPDARNETRVAWEDETSLNGFRVVAAPADSGGTGPLPGGPGPIVGVLGVLAGIAAIGLRARERQ